jgi:hypothetical protein
LRELFIEGAMASIEGVMASKTDISELRLQQLNTESLALIAKFADSLKIHNGNIISLRDEQALRSVVREAKRFDSAELQKIYAALKCALKTHLNITQNGI